MAEKGTDAGKKFSQSGAKQATRVKMGNQPGKRYGTDPFKKTKGGK